ncbi:MAG: diguanylate cyclase response regulator [Armatimonadota bacterium]|nr:MAG: diguanylate cyclase response regulator [Armatimonadota bacterium]
MKNGEWEALRRAPQRGDMSQNKQTNTLPTVLIVDDTEEIRRLVRIGLKSAGYNTVEASSGQEALFVIETVRPDIMVLDVMMPQMTGFEVLREMKLRFPDLDIPVIMLTAKTETDDKVEGFEAGAQDYMTKPFEPRELAARVKVLLRSKQERERLRIAAEGLQALSTTDELTKLHNRRHLMSRVSEAIAQHIRHGGPVSLLLFDIDRFKSVNDTYGHVAGDDLLRELADVLRPNIREEDVLARYGGEEFVMLLPSIPVDSAVMTAERVRELVAMHEFHCDGHPLRITVSIGVAGLPGDTVRTAEEFIAMADKRLYLAKHLGRNRVVGPEPPAKAEPSAA